MVCGATSSPAGIGRRDGVGHLPRAADNEEAALRSPKAEEALQGPLEGQGQGRTMWYFALRPHLPQQPELNVLKVAGSLERQERMQP